MNKMLCEQPTCSLESKAICKHHCHLSLCDQHRIEHESNLLTKFEKQLDDLTHPVSTLLDQSRFDLKQSEESRQHELDRINTLFDHHSSSINQHLNFSKLTTELLSNKREQLLKSKTGDYQLTKDDYQQIQNLSNQIQENLQEDYQLNNQIHNKNSNIHLWTINKENNVSPEIECIEISDSEDEIIIMEQSTENEICSTEIEKKSKFNLSDLRGFCPLTQYGAFGLQKTHNLPYLCSKSIERRCLFSHFTKTHQIKSPIAYRLVKAIRNGCDPMITKIFPQDNTSIFYENIPCPFDNTMIKLNMKYLIPNTPCYSVLNHHCFKTHLRTIHRITKSNIEFIYDAIKINGTINHIQFDGDLID